jgi:recombination protein RecA
MFGTGISKEGSILDLGVDEGIVAKSGSWFAFGEERLGQGREAAKEYLREHPDVRETIETAVRERLEIPPPAMMGELAESSAD